MSDFPNDIVPDAPAASGASPVSFPDDIVPDSPHPVAQPSIPDIIKKAATTHGVDQATMMALAEQESNFNPKIARKDTKAAGLYQFIPSTAKEYGIDPLDAEQSADAAARMLRKHIDHFGGDENAAISAHFGGPNKSMWGPKTNSYLQSVLAKKAKYSSSFPSDILPDTEETPTSSQFPNDIVPDQPEETSLQDTVRNTLGSVAGAADIAVPFLGVPGFALGMGATAVGGLKGIGDISFWAIHKLYDDVTGQPNGKTFDDALAEAVNDINRFSKWTPSHMVEKLVGSEDYLTGSKGYQTVQKPLQYLSEKAGEGGEYTAEKTGSPAVGAAVTTGLNILPWIAGAKALHSVSGSKGTINPEDPKVLDAIGQGVYSEARTTLENIANGKTAVSYHPEFKEAVKEAFVDPDINVDKILDLMADHPKTDPTIRILAQQFRERAADLNLGTVGIEIDPNMKEGAGEYNHSTDKVKFKTLEDATPERILHETTHVLTSAAIDMWKEVKAKTLDPKTLSDNQRDMLSSIDGLNSVFEEASKRVFNLKGIKDPVDWQRQVDAGLIKPSRDMYQFKNLSEFAAEVMSGRQEVRALHEQLGALPDNLKTKKSFEGRPLRGFFEAARDYIKRLIVGRNDFYQTAYDHVSNIIDKVDTQTRTKDFNTEATRNARAAEANYQSRMTDLLKMSDTANKALMYRIANILRNAKSPSEALTRIRADSLSDPKWQKLLNDHGFTIVKNARDIVQRFGTAREDLTPAEKLLTSSSLNLNDFMKEHVKKVAEDYKKSGLEPMNVHDLLILSKRDFIDEGSWLLPATQIKALKAQGRNALTGEISKFLIEKGEEYRALGAKMFAMSSEHFRTYNELNNVSKKNVMKSFIYFDGWTGSMKLKQLGLQWATEDILKQRGMNDKEVQAYKDATEGQDFLWNLMNQALIKQGKEPLPQIPGYMPHFFDGAYRVLVTRKIIDPQTGNPNTQVVRVRGFSTAWGAKKFVAALSAGKFDAKNEQGIAQEFRAQIDPSSGEPYNVILPEKPTTGPSIAIMDNVRAYRNMTKLDPATFAAIEKMEADAMQGTISHILERSNISGYRGDPMNEAAKDGGFETGLLSDLGLNSYNNKLLDTFNTYAKNVTDFYKNTMFMHEVAGPLFDHMPIDVSHKTYYGAMFDGTSKLKEYMEGYIRNFTGENLNPLRRIVDDEFVQPMLWLGLDPGLPGKFLTASRNFLSLSKLRGNIGFYVGNFIQPIHVTWQLAWAKEMLRQDGKDVSNLSVAKAFSDAWENRNSPEVQAAIQWARDNHIVDPRLEWELRHQPIGKLSSMFHYWTGGKLNPWIEQAAREFSFVTAHQFFKEIYKGDTEKIYRAAQNSMEMVNVNYDRISRPQMYQNFGMIGQAMSPFGVYRNAYIGNAWLMFRAVKSGKMSPASFMPLLSMQLAYLATAGAAGVMLTDEWDTLVGMWNHFNPEAPLPESKTAFMKFQKATGMGDWFTYGSVSAATKAIPGFEEGMYIGSSLNASGIDQTLDIALFPYWKALAALVGLGGKEVGHLLMPDTILPPVSSDMYSVAKALVPPQAQGVVEKYFSPSETVGTKGTDLTGYVDRTQAGWHSIYASGRPSVDEESRRMIQKQVDLSDEYRTKTLQTLVKMAVDENQGIPAGISASDRLQRAAQMGVDPMEFTKMVVDEMIRRQTSTRTREAMEPLSIRIMKQFNERSTMEQK